MKRSVSYSELSCWERDKQEYEDRYIRGIEKEPTREMKIGTMVHRVISAPDYEWLKTAKELGVPIPETTKVINKALAVRPDDVDVKMIAKLKDVEIFISMDALDKRNRVMDEYKTTDKPHWWPSQVHTFFQIDIYALVYYLVNHQFLREINLRELDYMKGNMRTIKTIRSDRDNRATSDRVLGIVSEIKKAGLWEKRLSRKERYAINQGKLAFTSKT